MVRIYTLTLAPSLDSATITPQIYPEGKLRCTAPVFEPGGGGINVARAIAHLGGSATAIFPAGWPRIQFPELALHSRLKMSPSLL